MYGTLCISGDVYDLSDEQWAIVDKGTGFYKKVSPVIADGLTKRFGPFQTSNRALRNYQAGVRYGTDGRALAIVHAFAHDGTLDVDIPLEEGYGISEIYETGDHHVTVTGSCIHMKFDEEFDAVAVLLDR